MASMALNFPEPLADKYRPQNVADFCGLEKPKRIMQRFVANPYASEWLFEGPSGTGKTSMGLAICKAVDGELHHIPSSRCNLETVQEVCFKCYSVPILLEPWRAGKFHVVLVDEADQMTNAAQVAFLSKLDATAKPPQTIFIFTCNSVAGLEPRFLSRTRHVQFSSYGMSAAIGSLLKYIWDRETDNPVERPDFARIAKDSNNNVRDALMSLEVAIMGA